MHESTHTHMSPGGRVVIPASYRKKLGLAEGQEVTISMDEFGIRISTPFLALRRLQALAAERVPKDRRLSDELIVERRAEAKRELAEFRRGKKPKK